MRAGPREQVLTRLATIQGHLDGIRRMVGHGAPTLEIIQQIRAVCSALSRIDELLVREELYSCLVLATEGRPGQALTEASWLLGLKPGGHESRETGAFHVHHKTRRAGAGGTRK